MASIFSKRGILYIGYVINEPSGKRKHIQLSLKLKDTRENRKIAKQIKAEKEAELLQPNKLQLKYHLRIDQALELFLKSKNYDSPRTKKNFKLAVNHLKKVIGEKAEVLNVTSSDIDRLEEVMKNRTNLSHNTISSYFRHLRILWNWLLREKYVSENVVKIIKAKEKPIRTITSSDFNLILEELAQNNENHYRIIRFLQLTGFRINEATSLTWEEIDFVHNRIIVKNQKAKRVEEFPLYPILKKFLLSFKEKSGFVFEFKNRDSMKFWSRTMTRLKLKYSLHAIRKTFATELVNQKVSVFDAMKLLRHRSVSTTMKYYTAVDMDRIGKEVNNVYQNLGLQKGSRFCINGRQKASKVGVEVLNEAQKTLNLSKN